MKSTLLALSICAGLSGCVAYGDPYLGAGYGYPGYSQPSYVYTQPSYGYSSPAYVYGSGVYVAPQYNNRARRDRDGDGIPNRVDRDRDNDGVPNAWDARPNNPRRR